MSKETHQLATRDPGFGVYIHWPFCAQKCPYCDFNSHVRFGGWDEARFLSAYKRELDYVAAFIAPLDSRCGEARLPSPRRGGGHAGSMPPAWGGVNPEDRFPEFTPTPNPSPQGGGGFTGMPQAVSRLPKCVAGENRTVSSIFFGGGTPSLMKPETVGAILDHIAKLWPIDPKAEITIEANPGSVEATRFQGYRAAGINRVSMGLQSLRDDELKKLGRIHTVAESKAALKIARDTFERFSFDLIYARPGQQPDAWRAELAEALDLAGDHISLYQLTIEPDTPYAALHAAGKLIVPDPDAALALYEITQEITSARGLDAYEISNHARAGEESRHNLLYWRYGEYAGVGPGAHGRLLIPARSSKEMGQQVGGGNSARLPSPWTGRGRGWGEHLGGQVETSRLFDTPTPNPSPQGEREKVTSLSRIATVTERNPEAWVARVEEHGHGFTERTEITCTEQADEMLMMGLRLREGVDLDRLAALGGVAPSKQAIDGLAGLGLLERLFAGGPVNWRSNELEPILMCLGPGEAPAHACEGTLASAPAGIIRATPKGRFVLNAVVAEISKSFTPTGAPVTAPSPMDNLRDAR